MPYLLVFFLARANANVWFIGETSIGKVKLASALMSMIKLGVFVAEIDFNVAELFTKLTTIAMCHAHFFFACTMVFAMWLGHFDEVGCIFNVARIMAM